MRQTYTSLKTKDLSSKSKTKLTFFSETFKKQREEQTKRLTNYKKIIINFKKQLYY